MPRCQDSIQSRRYQGDHLRRRTQVGGRETMLRLLAGQVRERNTQRVFAAALAGKMLGLLALYGGMVLLSALVFTRAHADGAVPADAPYISPINTAWTLIAAFLVFFMQAGFMCLE